MEPKSNARMKSRIKFLVAMFILCIAGLMARLGYIQVIKGEEYAAEAMSQQYVDALVPPVRGVIYDRTGKQMAISVPKHDVWLEVSIVDNSRKKEQTKEEARQETADKLGEILEISSEDLLAKINGDSPRFAVTKYISTEKVKEIREAKINGVWFEDSSVRYYPYGKFAAYVLGHVSGDNVGMAGVEASFNSVLKGVPGRKIFIKDARNREISTSDIKYIEPIEGNNLVLTIDEVIQHIMERAAQDALDKNQAKKVVAIAMNPQNGDILGMTTKPDYDPNNPRVGQYDIFTEAIEAAGNDEEFLNALYAMWRNPAVNDSYEPGSPFKLITSTAALEENLVGPEEMFYDKGYTEVADRKIRNWTSKPFGNISFTTAVIQSVNSTFIEVSQRMGKDIFLDYIDSYGFGRPTGIQLPGEGSGILYSAENMGPVQLATTSFGQGISVTPMQMINAVSAIANEGKLMKPRIVKEVTNNQGDVIRAYEPELVKRVISKETASTMLSIMEAVVTSGANGSNEIEGFRVGGKSGTAQKPVPGGYSPYFYVASYVGVAPIENPQIVVFVAVDEPNAGIHFGSAVAGPVVTQILMDSMRYLGIKPNVQSTEETLATKVPIPEIRNLSYTDAIILLQEAGLRFTVVGHGTENDTLGPVTDSFPKPGSMVTAGSEVMLYLSSDKQEVFNMPDLKGKTLKEAELILTNMGLEMTSIGTGKVVSQLPSPGTMIYKGNMVSLEFAETESTTGENPAALPGEENNP